MKAFFIICVTVLAVKDANRRRRIATPEALVEFGRNNPTQRPTASPTVTTYAYWLGSKHYEFVHWDHAEVVYFDWETTYAATMYLAPDEEKILDDDGGWYGTYQDAIHAYMDAYEGGATYNWGIYFELDFYTPSPTASPTLAPTQNPTVSPTADWWGELGFGSWEEQEWPAYLYTYTYTYYDIKQEKAGEKWWFNVDDDWHEQEPVKYVGREVNRPEQWWTNYLQAAREEYNNTLHTISEAAADAQGAVFGTDEYFFFYFSAVEPNEPAWWTNESLSPFENVDLSSPLFFDSFFFSSYFFFFFAVEDHLGLEMGESWWSAWTFFTPSSTYDDDSSRHNYQFFFYFSHVRTFFEGNAYFFFFFSHVPEQFFTPAFANPHCAGRRRRSIVSKRQATTGYNPDAHPSNLGPEGRYTQDPDHPGFQKEGNA